MRKTLEPGDDFQMTPGILGRKVVRGPFAQEPNSEPLVFDVLRMLERQIAEHPVVVRRV